jgi:hypothetical protein
MSPVDPQRGTRVAKKNKDIRKAVVTPDTKLYISDILLSFLNLGLFALALATFCLLCLSVLGSHFSTEVWFSFLW